MKHDINEVLNAGKDNDQLADPSVSEEVEESHPIVDKAKIKRLVIAAGAVASVAIGVVAWSNFSESSGMPPVKTGFKANTIPAVAAVSAPAVATEETYQTRSEPVAAVVEAPAVVPQEDPNATQKMRKVSETIAQNISDLKAFCVGKTLYQGSYPTRVMDPVTGTCPNPESAWEIRTYDISKFLSSSYADTSDKEVFTRHEGSNTWRSEPFVPYKANGVITGEILFASVSKSGRSGVVGRIGESQSYPGSAFSQNEAFFKPMQYVVVSFGNVTNELRNTVNKRLPGSVSYFTIEQLYKPDFNPAAPDAQTVANANLVRDRAYKVYSNLSLNNNFTYLFNDIREGVLIIGVIPEGNDDPSTTAKKVLTYLYF